MPDHDEEILLTPAERELEAALTRLTPAPPRTVTASQIETRALIARERRRTRAWQAVAAALTLGATASLWLRPTPPPQIVEVERIVVREVERPRTDNANTRWALTPDADPSPPAAAAPADFPYLHLRQRVLARGVESLPASRATPADRRPVPQALSRTAADRNTVTAGDRS